VCWCAVKKLLTHSRRCQVRVLKFKLLVVGCSDALLADLQTTRANKGDVTTLDNNNYYDNYDDDDRSRRMYYHQQEQRAMYSDARVNRQSSPTPPPLPPLPSRDILDTVHASTVCSFFSLDRWPIFLLLLFWWFKVIQGHQCWHPKKLVTSACYDKQYVCACLQLFSR